MKLMIASDIHGSSYYCKKLLEAFKKEKPNKLLLLGDLLYHGPRNDLPKEYHPKEVISMLNSISDHILCVRGNCEAEVDQMVLDFPVLSDSCILYLDKHLVFATHGHIYSPENPPKLKKGDILLNGHTHIPAWEQKDPFLYLNPGSVSIPKNNSPHGYMIWENDHISWKTFENSTTYHEMVL
ncbi:phosphodiesterase [Anaerostipes sp. MSJ-23]|uniref:phosphodiesterase n=1 Tax=Anaerostipes sp. MSJ-23 TaxID=2841520 RepID=UPI001C0F7574|nr:phosphodiesterase [Anaerostipes sp. MSJ-23]MBU5459872.1 phosphodiesterase [Anaerostipes sp. MSJ-23]